jgi:peptidoglycan/xylan/chitin deacetylase (PgdA/CDA1 family)
MLARGLGFLLSLLCLLLAACARESPPAGGEAGAPPRREIALSFDDAPTPDGPTFTGAERTERILAAMAEEQVEGAIFFATTHGLGRAEGRERLLRYAAAGHVIGNHTASHLNLAEVSAEAFLDDVRLADETLRALPGFVPLFRYPHSQEGNDPATREKVRRGLAELGYGLGYFTVDAADWDVEELYEEALAKGRTADEDELRRSYLDATTHALDFYDGLARAVLHRSPKHVLLLHESDINALFLGDLLRALRAQGFTLISAQHAYDDPLFTQIPDNARSQSRITGLALAAGVAEPIEDPWAWPDRMAVLFAGAFR